MQINKPVVGTAVAVVMVAAGIWYFLHSRHVPPALPSAEQPQPAQPLAQPSVEHPLPGEDAGSAAPLPSLAGSDSSLSEALALVAGRDAIKNYLLPENIIRHLVVTIDNLPRQKVAVEKRPTGPVAGSLIAAGDEMHATLDTQNFARYQQMVAVIDKLDMQRLAAVYIRFYPLFQQAYQDLGYPNGYFNDRLVQVIDGLLAAPAPTDPIDLVRPNVLYLYADPALESRSAGQKLLIRMGPANAAVIKAKLRELRSAITAAAPKR